MSIIGDGFTQEFGFTDLRLRELERRVPVIDDGMPTGACEGAVKLFFEGAQSTPASTAPYLILWTGSLYACTASMMVSGDGVMVEQAGVWHVTGTVRAVGAVDSILELWTDHGTTNHVLSSDYRSAAETGNESRMHVSQDVFLDYGDSLWLVLTPQAATSISILAEPQLALSAHLVACDCGSDCNWTEDCAGWDLTC